MACTLLGGHVYYGGFTLACSVNSAGVSVVGTMSWCLESALGHMQALAYRQYVEKHVPQVATHMA
jgi:hypothetical protein